MSSGEVFLMRCEPMLISIARSIRSRSLLLGFEDLVQEAHIIALKAIRKHRGPIETLTGYVYVCVLRALLKLARKNRDPDETDDSRKDTLDMSVVHEDLTDKVFSRQVSDRVFQLVRDPTDRKILRAFMQGLSDRETAAKLQIHLKSIQQRRNNLFKWLKKKLTQEGLSPSDDENRDSGEDC